MKERTLTAVLAIIALSLLALLILILLQGSQGIEHYDSCETFADADCYDACPETMIEHPTVDCKDANQKCCLPSS
jgi:hypothetical protein